MDEVDVTRRFQGPHVIRVCDAAVVREETRGSAIGNVPTHDEENAQGHVVYLVLPYYAQGSLQDAIAHHSVHGTRFDEHTTLTLFLGACRAVQAMHSAPPDVAPGGDVFDAEAPSAYPPAKSMTPSSRVAYAHRDIKPAYVHMLTQQRDDRGRWMHRCPHGFWQCYARQNTHPYTQGGRGAPGPGRGTFVDALSCS